MLETDTCRAKYGSGYTRRRLRSSSIARTSNECSAWSALMRIWSRSGRAEGLNEGAAMLRANKEMERLGYYPKSPTIVAHREACGTGAPVPHL